MPWRKIQGEQAPEWVSQDPFAPPVWRPPVWRLPEGVILLAHFFKALARVAVALARHPLPAVVVAGLGWLGWRYGWPAALAVVGVAASGLGGWCVGHRSSFRRLVALPALAQWRWLWTYRRHWQPVLLVAGLARNVYGREYVPTLRRVVCTEWTDRVLVKMLPGQAPTDWASRADQLAHGFAARSCRVKAARPGRVWLELPRRDPLAEVIPALPIPEHVDLTAVPVGRCEDGTPWRLRLHGTHVLVAGATGSGKGSLIWSVVRALLPAIRAGLVQVWAADPKLMELSYGRDLFHRYAADAADVADLLDAAVAEMQKRAASFAGRLRAHTATRAHPFLLVIVDEVAFLTAYHPDRNLRARVSAALATLTTQGRAVGVGVLAAVQDPRKEVVGIRNLFPDKIALRLDESEQVDMVLGEGARDRGAYADEIAHTLPGVGYVRMETSPDPVRVRAAYPSDDDITAMARTHGRGGLRPVGSAGDAA